MATDLARRPNLLDAMLDRRFSVPLSEEAPGAFALMMKEAMERAVDYEDALNAARRLVREERFRIGAQILRGQVDADSAGMAFTEMAEVSLHAMADAAQRETERRFGAMPGQYVLLGMGKLGGRELASDSDLDMMII